jgi:hypothetical protein
VGGIRGAVFNGADLALARARYKSSKAIKIMTDTEMIELGNMGHRSYA